MSYMSWKTIASEQAVRAVRSGAKVWALPGGGFFSGGHTYTHGLQTNRGTCYVVSKIVMRAVVATQARMLEDSSAKTDIDWPRADPDALKTFDPSSKACTMNCGPHGQDPRKFAERKFLCTDCETNGELL
ncbi:TPA: hypothetical protein ACPWO2_006388 [Pseudomonas aeruginosa]|uniref:hypothetical protein n=1 Tax=Pseudomonas aeruginosa group TaxID=136841 RepID=UPI001D0B4C04|nr:MULTISPECIES: hypothetical protein [Pseudomonas aeruginosa group]ELQ8316866.1 hypothetical protein [Pseudomonas aeruginosa]MCC0246420.1 hypothetical protein [Pseudomonas aeruginosa]MDG9858398.1 hypothetical protein [Pseudomonas nitroreducens]MDH1077219.1 hypothetical protein [Pseudomonas nitroreducens]HEJ3670527.1 hypothetical protein [Pseudomonas aeruginosa]